MALASPAVLKVWDGATWNVVLGKAWTGSAWNEKMHFYNGIVSAWQPLYPSGPQVSLNPDDKLNLNSNSTCYAGVQYYTNGTEFATSPSGSWNRARGDWLDSGSNNDVWIERTINSGSLNSSDPGAGRFQMNVNRTYRVVRTVVGTHACNLTIDMYDAASGGNLLDSVTYTLEAEYFFFG